jgi:hypothetical protein
MTIQMVKVRARIKVGTTFTCETPYIQRFNVNKTRGQAATFDASLKVANKDVLGNISGDSVTIEAGVKGASLPTIFTGFIKKVSVSPCYDDPSYVILSVSGIDPIGYLDGKKYTRRCRATKGTYVTIDGVQRKGLKSGKFGYNKKTSIEMSGGDIDKKEQLTETRDITAPKTKKAPSDESKQGVPIVATGVDAASNQSS